MAQIPTKSIWSKPIVKATPPVTRFGHVNTILTEPNEEIKKKQQPHYPYCTAIAIFGNWILLVIVLFKPLNSTLIEFFSPHSILTDLH